MSATTPLMSEYPVDVKKPVDSGLPVYRINEEAEQLTVGRRQCFWRRFCHGRGACARSADERREKRRNCARRFIKFFMITFFFFSIGSFFAVKHKMNCMMKHHPVICVPLESAGSTELTLPLAHWHTHVALHHSLNGGDIKITHSDDVPEGNVTIKFDVPSEIQLMDDEEVPEYYVCHIAGPKFVGVGLHSKDKKAQRVKATSTTITLPSKEAGHARAVNVMGPPPRFHHGKHGHGHGRGHFWKKLGHKFSIRRRIHRAIRKAVHDAAELAAWKKVEYVDVE